MKASPAFQFYPQDWIASQTVKLMSNAERGAYINLLSHCWIENGLPVDLDSLARLADEPIEIFKIMWARLEACFVETRGKYQHKRLLCEKKKQKLFSAKQRQNANKLWSLSSKPRHSQTDAKKMPRLCSSSSSLAIATTIAAGKPALEIPEDLKGNSKDIEAWVAYKRERGQTYKPLGLNALWARLRGVPAAQRSVAIEQAMANNYSGIHPPKDTFFQKPAGAQTPSGAETSAKLKREKLDMIAQEIAFSQAESALKSLPRVEFEAIHAEALKRLPGGLAGQKFKDSLLPPLLVEVWREREEVKHASANPG